MTNKNRLVLGLLVLGLFMTVPALAQEETAGPTTRERVESQLADLKERLALSDYTWNQVHLILKTSIRERVAIAKKYGLEQPGDFDAMSGKDKRRLGKELKKNRKDTQERMERYLDKDQMKEFKAIQEEVHQEWLARRMAQAG